VDFGGGPLTAVGHNDIFVVKFDPGGNHLWSQRFGDDDNQGGFPEVAADPSGNIVITGYYAGTVDFGGGALASAGNWDIYTAKFDPSGNHLCSQRFGDASPQLCQGLALDGSGNIVITGAFRGVLDFGGGPLSNPGDYDVFVAKFDPSLNHLHSQRFGDGQFQNSLNCHVDNIGNIFITGEFWGTVDFGGGLLTSAGGDDIFLAKFDPSGNHVWSQGFPGAAGNWQQGRGVATDESGNAYLTGWLVGVADFGGGVLPSGGGGDVFLAKFDALTGSVAGYVTADCLDPPGLSGATVDAFDQVYGALRGVASTGADGYYQIDRLEVGLHNISVVPPIGYSAPVDEVTVTIVDGVVATADFELYCLDIEPTQRSQGFWKHQVGVALGGKGHAQITGATLCGYLDLIEAHFNSNAINQVVIYEPPASGECTDKLEVAKSLLNLKGNVGMTARAKQQLMALLLNVAGEKLSLRTVISVDGATVSQAITHCDRIIDNPTADHEAAKTIADMINNAVTVPIGMIPLTTDDIDYSPRSGSNLPKRYALLQNYPNPFNPTTTIGYELAAPAHVRLDVYDVTGRLVARLLDEQRRAGSHTADWDAKNLVGRPVASGIYLVRFEASGYVETMRVVVMK
jgi:hypothetical protein